MANGKRAASKYPNAAAKWHFFPFDKKGMDKGCMGWLSCSKPSKLLSVVVLLPMSATRQEGGDDEPFWSFFSFSCSQSIVECLDHGDLGRIAVGSRP